jgi:predicted kinase
MTSIAQPTEAVIFIGMQASGKTSFYRQRFFETHLRIGLDMVRTRQREQLLLAACLESKQSFVIDNTNPVPADRARYIERSREAGFRVVAYFFLTSLEDAIRRNLERTGKQRVPVPAIAATFRKLLVPSPEEGFEALYTVTVAPEGAFVVQPGIVAAFRPPL